MQFGSFPSYELFSRLVRQTCSALGAKPLESVHLVRQTCPALGAKPLESGHLVR
jgi:hypothetical protein